MTRVGRPGLSLRRPVFEPPDRTPEQRARLNLLIDANLKDWAKGFASRRQTTVTAIITDHLVKLRDMETSADVEQI